MTRVKTTTLALSVWLSACAADETGVAYDDESTQEDIEIGETSQALYGANARLNRGSGRCMGVDGGSTANGARIKQFTCDGRRGAADNQHWRRIGGKLVNGKSGKCLTASGPLHGDNIVQQPCFGDDNRQMWNGIETSDGWHTLVNEASGLCIGVDGASTANGAQLKVFACGWGNNQQWREHLL